MKHLKTYKNEKFPYYIIVDNTFGNNKRALAWATEYIFRVTNKDDNYIFYDRYYSLRENDKIVMINQDNRYEYRYFENPIYTTDSLEDALEKLKDYLDMKAQAKKYNL